MSAAAETASGLLDAFVLDGAGGGEAVDWNGVERWRPPDGVLWLNVDYVAPDAQTWLALRSGIDPVVRDALLDRDPRPRALAIGSALLLVVRGINLAQGAEPDDMVSVRCWIEPHRILTLHHRPVGVLQTLAHDVRHGAGPRTAGDLVATLVDQVLEPVVTAVDAIGDEVAAIEDELLDRPSPAQRHRIAELRRRAIGLRRFIGPQRDALGKLAAIALPWLDDDQRARLREAADRQARTVEELDAARDRAGVTHEELQSRMDELTGRRLYALSIITAIFLPLSFVTGLLGVNVGGVPAQHVSWAFWALCGGFTLAIAVQLWLFRRWRWL